jgi:hypothetical protein
MTPAQRATDARRRAANRHQAADYDRSHLKFSLGRDEWRRLQNMPLFQNQRNNWRNTTQVEALTPCKCCTCPNGQHDDNAYVFCAFLFTPFSDHNRATTFIFCSDIIIGTPGAVASMPEAPGPTAA